MTHNDILKKLAEKYNLPEEQIKLVVTSFYNGFRHYLTNPLESKDGILIHNFLSFYIDKKKIKNFIERLKLKDADYKPTAEQNKIEFYEELLKNKVKYERQKTKTNDNQRSCAKP